MKKKESNAEYIYCASHSINLVLNDACDDVPEIKKFFDLIQKIYMFFGVSIKRWKHLMRDKQS